MTSATETSATASTPKKPGGARVAVQRFGTFLSSMVMPNIPAFIAWGIITALFIPEGPFPNKAIGGLVGPMITYLLPLLLANTGGRLVYGVRGGVVGTIAAMGVIVGSDIPMFIGAMIMGPLGGYLMKLIDKIWEGKIKAGFEMLVNNFSAGILGFLLAIGAFFGIAPLVEGLSKALEAGVNWLVSVHLLPLVSILVEPGKVLFLNNAINHGVFTPIGTLEAQQTGKSILFLIETNPGPGAGILLAWAIFGLGAARASAPGAFIIQFFGGIHEIYFPYVLMKPILIIGAVLGGMTGVAVNVAFQTGLRAPAAPGSVFAIFAQAPVDNMFGIAVSIVAAAAVSFAFSAIVLRATRKRDLAAGNAGDLSAAVAQTEANKGKSSSVLGSLVDEGEHDAGDAQGDGTDRLVRNIVFACDAGMGSSAMGASVLRNKIKKAGVEGVTVTNQAIANLDGTADLVITQQQLTDRAKGQSPASVHVSVDNFMNSPRYDEVVDLVKSQQAQAAPEDASK
ncbi:MULTISPECIES: PTS mannitol transporter subunit IICB [unclassified Leifsonia]|uniref:PTS mannitol transporter subunit IICB n=1 Tax=unclassified Leifsonia TaxID=2663824 RepID=UPI00092B35E9|nr:PTS mannitol transporter subunit IICB [Leifsonia sp. 71-9]OJX80691.1 MAG: PTS mannitol transporter subunit IIB [Leifsonia sp. 71-9]